MTPPDKLMGEALAYLFEQYDEDMPIGIYSASINHDEPQSEEWKCGGCNGVGHTYWPEWGKPDFKHEPGCRYIAAREALKRYKHPEKPSMPSWAEDMGNGMWAGVPPNEPSQNTERNNCSRCGWDHPVNACTKT